MCLCGAAIISCSIRAATTGAATPSSSSSARHRHYHGRR